MQAISCSVCITALGAVLSKTIKAIHLSGYGETSAQRADIIRIPQTCMKVNTTMAIILGDEQHANIVLSKEAAKNSGATTVIHSPVKRTSESIVVLITSKAFIERLERFCSFPANMNQPSQSQDLQPGICVIIIFLWFSRKNIFNYIAKSIFAQKMNFIPQNTFRHCSPALKAPANIVSVIAPLHRCI